MQLSSYLNCFAKKFGRRGCDIGTEEKLSRRMVKIYRLENLMFLKLNQCK